MGTIILEDSARISATEVEKENRWREHQGLEILDPLYEPQDMERTLSLMWPLLYEELIEAPLGIKARLIEAGYMAVGLETIQSTLSVAESMAVSEFVKKLSVDSKNAEKYCMIC